MPHEPTYAEFQTEDPVNLPVPSPELLALHAMCCKVAHLSGATEFFEKTRREVDDLEVLSADGTSANALHFALLSKLGDITGAK